MKLGLKKVFICALSVSILILYVAFLYIDKVGRADQYNISIRLKYISILFCFMISLIIGKDGYSERDKFLLRLGLFFTCLADLNLLVLDNFGLGVVLFCVVQTIYIHRYNPGFKVTIGKILGVIVYEGLVLVAIYSTSFASGFNLLYIAAPLYVILLVLSVLSALATFKRKVYPEVNCYIVSIGMLLFFACDLNVALYNIFSESSVKVFGGVYLSNLSVFLIWFFYLPSQLLLSLSGYRCK